jgi:hypothetical protein
MAAAIGLTGYVEQWLEDWLVHEAIPDLCCHLAAQIFSTDSLLPVFVSLLDDVLVWCAGVCCFFSPPWGRV